MSGLGGNRNQTEHYDRRNIPMPETDTFPKSRWFNRETSALILIDHQIGTMQLVKNIASDATNPI